MGDLTSFFLYTAYVGGSFVGLSTFYSELMKGIGASKRIMELRSLPVNGIELQKRSVKRIENLSGLIEFKNVRYFSLLILFPVVLHIPVGQRPPFSPIYHLLLSLVQMLL